MPGGRCSRCSRSARRSRCRSRPARIRISTRRTPPRRDRRRGRDRRQRRHGRGARRPAARRQRGRRRGRRGGGARRHRAVLVRHRRRRLHGHPHPERQGHDDRLARDGARRRCSPTRSSRTATRAPVRRRALQRVVGRRARHAGRAGTRRCAALRHVGPPPASLAPAIDVARARLLRRPDVQRADHAEPPVVRRHPVHRGALPRPRRHREGRRLGAAQPRTWRRRTSASPATAPARASIAGRSPRRWRRPPSGPPVGATADKEWRPGLLTVEDLARYAVERREPTRVGYRGYDVYSMGPPSSGGSTVGEALNLLEQIPGYRGCPTRTSCTTSSRRRATRSPTATCSSPTRTTSTSRCAGCSRTPTRRSGRA